MENRQGALWRVEDIFASDQDWEQGFLQAGGAVQALGSLAGTLGEPAGLKAALDHLFDTSRKVEALLVYAQLKRDQDKRAALYQGMLSRAQTLAAQAQAAGAFFAPELLALPPAYLEETQREPKFKNYRVFLDDIARQRPHTLSAREEQLLAMMSEVGEGPETIYEMLTDADMRFPEIEGEDGKTVRLTQANYVPLMMNPDRRVRKAAFEALYDTYGQYQATIPAAYAASVKYDQVQARVRNFASARQMSLFESHIPEKVYDNLLTAVKSHLPALNHYLKVNARRLGLGQMTRWDIYAPAAKGFELKLPFDEAVKLVADCLAPLGEDYQQMVLAAPEKGWLDPYERPGKHSGAYAWGTYDSHPYVLLNYHQTLDGVLTLAHELGHAMHTHFSSASQPYPTSDYALFVAEVASTVNEVLMMLRLLERYPAAGQQAYLLNNLLDSYHRTLFRQALFAKFEWEAHRMAQAGQALTGESLNALYAEINKAWYPAVAPCERIALEWMRIPHFYRAFYVYVYATGFSAATAIARDLFAGKPGAAEGYRAFLSAGSSLPPIEALKMAGVDMEQPEPVERALNLFETLLAKYEGLNEG